VPHDQFFDALLEQPGAAGALLRERLPEALASQLVGDPELIEGTFIDEAHRESRTDRLYRLRLKTGGAALVYCLLEHKSARQLLDSFVQIWVRLDRDAGGCGPLPPVLPLVVYHGWEEWKAPVRLSRMPDLPLPVMNKGLIDDAKVSPDQPPRTGQKAYTMMLTGERRLEVVEGLVTQVCNMPDGSIHEVVHYIGRAYGAVDPQAEAALLERAVPEAQMLSTPASEWVDLGKTKAKGKDAPNALLKVLEKLFGAVPDDYRQRILQAQAAEVEAWLYRAVEEATSLEAVFDPPAH
jgi:hypothetical protein